MAENISVELPESVKFDYANRIIITVSNKADNAAKGYECCCFRKAVEDTEIKSLTGVTDKDGVIILPPISEGISPIETVRQIFPKPYRARDTDGDGKSDTEETKTEYNITVEDTKGKIEKCLY